jgi:hypothetical protein
MIQSQISTYWAFLFLSTSSKPKVHFPATMLIVTAQLSNLVAVACISFETMVRMCITLRTVTLPFLRLCSTRETAILPHSVHDYVKHMTTTLPMLSLPPSLYPPHVWTTPPWSWTTRIPMRVRYLLLAWLKIMAMYKSRTTRIGTYHHPPPHPHPPCLPHQVYHLQSRLHQHCLSSE